MKLEIGSVSIEAEAEEVRFDFKVSDDCVRNSNSLGFAKTWRQQCWLNHDRNERKRKLVEMGKTAGSEYIAAHPDFKKIDKAFLVVEVANKSKHRFDPPNYELTMKDIEDGLVQAGIIEDDNSNVIVGTLFKASDVKDKDAVTMSMSFWRLA